jgi:hypothetical protein
MFDLVLKPWKGIGTRKGLLSRVGQEKVMLPSRVGHTMGNERL